MGLIGYNASKDFHLGLAPYIAMWNGKGTFSDTNSTDFDRSSSSLGANLGFVYMIKKGWIEGAIKFRMNKYKSESTQGSTTSTVDNDGGIELGAGFRAWIYPSKSSKVAVVPLLTFSTYSFQPKLAGPVSATGLNYSWMNFGGAVGLNWPVMDDIQIAGGIGATYNSLKADSNQLEIKSNGLFAPTYNMAVETRIADWLTGRMGFSRHVENYSYTATNPSNTAEFTGTSPSSDVNTFSMGAGFHFGRFSIDATLNESWVKHGINFISGGDNHDLFGEISASYNFGK
jgi:hypothetical protein